VIVQTFQSAAQRGMMVLLSRSSRPVRAPAILTVLPHVPGLRTLPARFLAFGLVPVHVSVQEGAPPARAQLGERT